MMSPLWLTTFIAAGLCLIPAVVAAQEGDREPRKHHDSERGPDHVLDLEGAKVIGDEGPRSRPRKDLVRVAGDPPVLIFETLDAFKGTINGLLNHHPDVLDKWESSIKFRSLRTTNEALGEQEDVDAFGLDESRIPDPYFETLLNPQGRIKVAGVLYEFSLELCRILNEGGETVREVPLKEHALRLHQKAHTRSTKCWNWKKQNCVRLLNNGKNKVRGQKMVWYGVFYSTVTMSTGHYKKKKKLFSKKTKWKRTKAPWIHLLLDQWHVVEWSYSSNLALTTSSSNIGKSKSNDRHISYVIANYIGTPGYICVRKFGRVHHWTHDFQIDAHCEPW